MKIPCENCLLIPTCKHKEYSDMMDECSTLCNFLYNYGRSDYRNRKKGWKTYVIKLEHVLTPTKWRLEINPATKTTRELIAIRGILDEDTL